jgi:iron complex outermembrane recepter protein
MRLTPVSRAVLLCASMTIAGGAAAQEGPDDAPPPDTPEAQESEPAPLQSIPVEPSTEAAPAPAPQRAERRKPVLEEVIVTAQKREESLQDAPVSVTAFDARALEQRGIQGTQDLAGSVPGVNIEPFPINLATLRIFIRGIGILDAQVTQDAPISVYQDGVYIGRSVGLAFDVADLQRIEVLRGPQGTLYGRNTTGGAVNLITQKPSTEGFTMSHKLSYASRNYLQGKSVLNVPFGENLAVKLAALVGTADGFMENTGPGGDFGDKYDRSVRFDARWTPTDWLTADYAFDYSTTIYYQYPFQAITTPESDHGQAEPFKRYAQTQTVYSTRRLDSLATTAPMEESRVRIGGHAVTLTAPIDAIEAELKYIVAYRRLFDESYPDLGGGKGSPNYRLDTNVYDGPAAFEAIGGPTPLAWLRTSQEQWSHELQLSGSLADYGVQYIAGLFYFDEDAWDDYGDTLVHRFDTLVAPNELQPLIALNPELAALLLDNVSPRIVNFAGGQNDVANESVAAYGQATWSPDLFDRRLHLTFGYRHTEDKREAIKSWVSPTYLEVVPGEGPAVLLMEAEVFDNVRGYNEFRNDSYAFITAYDLTDDINLYAKYVEAYRSGGFDIRDPQISGDSGPASDGIDYGFGFVEGFKPEYVASYEAGMKSEWLDRRLRVNLNLFHMDQTDRQISALISGAISDTKTRNVGKSRTRGIELDTLFALTGSITLLAEYSFLDAETLEVLDIEGNNVAENYQPYSAPEHSGVAAIDWSILEADWGNVAAFVSASYMAERKGQTLPGHAGQTRLEPYTVYNARLGLNSVRFGRGLLDMTVWGRNLSDKEYSIAAIDNLPHADRSVLWAEPRTLGLDLTYRWD